MSTTAPSPSVLSAAKALLSASVPSPPLVPAVAAPRSDKFSGYKLDPAGLPCTRIDLAQPLCTTEGSDADDAAGATGTSAAPTSFHAVSQRLKTNQLVVLRSEDPRQPGAHAVFYCDHKAVWQVDPPAVSGASSPMSRARSSSGGGSSHMIYEFDEVESGDGMSFVGVSPCFLLLTRAGGRLTILLVDIDAGHHLTTSGSDLPATTVVFDGVPLCAAPLRPHHATISAAMMSAERDALFVVLYEFWQQESEKRASAFEKARREGIAFVHQDAALRSAGIVGPQEVTEGFAAISAAKHALHKLTVVEFTINNVPVLRPATMAAASSSVRNVISDGAPSLSLVHSFSSVQNYQLPRDDLPSQQLAADSSWSAPLACWLSLPTPIQAGALEKPAPYPPGFYLWVAARVPYLNETESVVHELARVQADKESLAAAAAMQARDRADEVGTDALAVPAYAGANSPSSVSASSVSAAAASSTPKFTSEHLLPPTHNLKHYAVDAEGDDGDDGDLEDEMGLADPSAFSLRPSVDVSLRVFGPLCNLLARRPLKRQTFLFAQTMEDPATVTKGGRAEETAVAAVKHQEDLVLYGVSTAAQFTPEGLSLGAAGAVAPASPELPRVGIVLRPLFSFAGLGYVTSGKQYKKFFMEDGSHNFVLLAEYTRLAYVYGRPSAAPDAHTAPQHLLQVGADDEIDAAAQIYGMQTALVPAAASVTAGAKTRVCDADPAAAAAADAEAAPPKAKPLIYLLTRRACSQFQLPLVALPQQTQTAGHS